MTKAELYQKACMLPLLPGVYIIRDKSDTIIYIGKAKSLRIRVSQYFREGVPHDNKVSQMIAHAYAFDVIVCQSEFEALVLEASQIKAHTPKYNILLKDDKGYSYIKVTKEPWPRLSFTLQKEDDGAEYLGPYTSSFAARQMAETAMDAFLLPRCNKRFPQDCGKGRPCLNAHIGKCMAVCSGRISCENYNQAVKSAVHLIRYGKKDILKTLNERMQEASDRLEFETAALLRDQINAITKVTAGQKVVVDPDVEMDVVALAGTPSSVCAAVLRFREGRLTDKREFLFHDTADIAAVREEFLPRYYLDDEQIPKVIAVDELPPDSDALQQALNEKRGSEVQLYVPQRGDKAHLVEMAHTNAVERLARESGRYAREEKLLDEMAQVLGLPKPPRTIESYDISNWGDGTSVCGMVTFRDGKPYKAGYRKFKMQTVAGTDDYASLAETVSRRAAEYEKYALLAEHGQESDNYFGQKPDLLLMDGGRGQVSAAKAALAGTRLADVPLYGMVKDDHHRTRAIVDSDGREIAINMNRGTFTFITAIQDETHRFANAYRKQQMKQKSYSSTLTEVPGVGPKTAKALLAQFKSVGAVKEATPDQLENTPGVGKQLAQVLGLSKPPRAIESYDISNWGDGSSVCGMVTFKDGKPFKAGYRKFKMKTVAGTDDYASLAETVSRRAAEYEKYAAQVENGQSGGNWFGQKPDLLLMDGGRGQVSAAKEALAGTALADVPLYGMVKDDHHRTRAIVDSDGREIAINMNRGTFTFITAIQDETHRFANAYRKQQMKQKSYSSTLTEVPGVGPKTAKALLAQFKSVGAVKEATPDQLENTPGVGRQLAQTIYDYFHQA